jgi:hydroxypyruvate isomerase
MFLPRHEFGSGDTDWTAELSWLADAGYQGFVGIEAIPLGDSSLLYAGAKQVLGASLN